MAALIQALNRPVDATAIAITAQASRGKDRLDLSVAIDAASLDLEFHDGLWKGEAEVVGRFIAADATQVGHVVSRTAIFNLRPATYAEALERGIPYLRLLVGNLATGRIGTLTVPLAQATEPMR